MKNQLLILFIFLIISYSCGKKSINSTNEKPISESSKAIVIDKSLLNGIWAESETENANFYIKGNLMYFVEDTVPCIIEIRNDTLVTFYDGLVTYDKILKLDNDSLILLNEIGDYIKMKRRN